MADYIPTNARFVNPYHFIELVRQLEEKFKYQDRKAEGNLTGWLECTLKTKSSIFIPNATSVKEDKEGNKYSDVFEIKSDKEQKIVNSYDFYSYTNLAGVKKPPEPVPVIPGSEIRGMIRSAYEAVTNSCLSTIDDEQILYKRVQYKADCGPARLICKNGNWKLEFCEERIGIAFRSTPGDRHNFASFINTLNEGERVFIKKGTKYKVRGRYPAFTVVDDIQKNKAGHDYVEGFFHKGEPFGNRKHHESIFVPTGKMVDIDKTAVKNLLENFKLYRDKTVNLHLKPRKGSPKQHSGYRHIGKAENLEDMDGKLVYCTKRGNRYYLCPAAIGREVFHNRLTNLIHESYRPCKHIDHLCEACALFGVVGTKKEVESQKRSAASRIRFTDALTQPGHYEFDHPKTLLELASPKLSATEFYLKDPQNAELWNYDYAGSWGRNAKGKADNRKWNDLENYTPEIRGRKFYWHQKDADVEHKGELTERNVHVRPLKSGIFSFKVYFNNITEEELHKLLWVLEIGGKDSHAHKIGMGKPIGLGSVQIRVDTIKLRDLNLVDESVQYKIDDTYEKPDYSEVEKGKFPHQKIVEQFLRITNFDDAPVNVSYPYNEAVICEETPDGKSPTYQWFGANKQIQETDGTGTAPVIYKALPKWDDEHFPELPVYKAQE